MTTPKTWAPEQFWEYAAGLLGEHVRDQMRDTLAARGLTITPASRCDVQNGDEKVPVSRPVAFRVPRVVDDKISKIEFRLFDNEDEARRAACDIGADYDGLYLVADRRAAFFAQPVPSSLSSAKCQCQPLTRYADAPHDPSCPLSSTTLGGEK